MIRAGLALAVLLVTLAGCGDKGVGAATTEPEWTGTVDAPGPTSGADPARTGTVDIALDTCQVYLYGGSAALAVDGFDVEPVCDEIRRTWSDADSYWTATDSTPPRYSTRGMVCELEPPGGALYTVRIEDVEGGSVGPRLCGALVGSDWRDIPPDS